MRSYKLYDGQNYAVRRADDKDLEELLHLLLEMAKEDSSSQLSFKEAESQIMASKNRLRELLKNKSESTIYLIGTLGQEIISFCDIHIGKNLRDSHTAELGRSVLKKYRRTGAGKYLQQEAIRFLRSLKSIERIELNIASNNENAIKSCESNGFKLEATRRKKLKFEDGSYADLHTYTMCLKLKS